MAPTGGPPMMDMGPASVWRRLGALVDDGLLLAAVLFIGTQVLLPLTGGQPITPQDSGPWEYAYRAWVTLLVALFFGYSWTRRGQTLGMMSWKVRLQREDGTLPGWHSALLRLGIGLVPALSALLGLVAIGRGPASPLGAWGTALLLPAVANYLWMGFDPEARTLQDRLSGCRVVRVG
jgi:uncharacterized RDD family membrane protein YckC